jgi:hypothetical protein
MQTTYIFDKHNSLGWNEPDALVFSYASDILAKRITCMILFVGRKVTRFPIEPDRELLKEYGFELTFINHLYLTNILNNVFFHKCPTYFEGEYFGYTLMAFSNQVITKEQILRLFMLPYKNIIPFWVFAHNTFYTKQRLVKHSTQAQQNVSSVLGLSPVFLFIIVLHDFLRRTILRNLAR